MNKSHQDEGKFAEEWKLIKNSQDYEEIKSITNVYLKLHKLPENEEPGELTRKASISIKIPTEHYMNVISRISEIEKLLNHSGLVEKIEALGSYIEIHAFGSFVKE